MSTGISNYEPYKRVTDLHIPGEDYMHNPAFLKSLPKTKKKKINGLSTIYNNHFERLKVEKTEAEI